MKDLTPKQVAIGFLAAATIIGSAYAGLRKYNEEKDVSAIRAGIEEVRTNRLKGYSETETASYVEDNIVNFKRQEPMFIGNSVISNLETELAMAKATQSTNKVYRVSDEEIKRNPALKYFNY